VLDKAAQSHMTAGLRAEQRGLPVGTTLVEVGLVKPTETMDRGLPREPARRAFRRFYKLGLLTDTSLERPRRATVKAVRAGGRSRGDDRIERIRQPAQIAELRRTGQRARLPEPVDPHRRHPEVGRRGDIVERACRDVHVAGGGSAPLTVKNRSK
jgi:hypothetical protein